MLESVYVHIPFCKQKCLYCDFNSFDNKKEKIEEYMAALYKECSKYTFNRLKTIYIGGGTPSFIEPQYIERILGILPEAEEVTIEANPCTVTAEKLEIYKKAGVNRLSIGLQSTNDNILKEIGRAHTFEEFDKAFKLAREKGFKNINVDLMFGLPNQSLIDLKKSVDYLIGLSPEHISCYSLIVHENVFENLPPDDEERRMYYYTKDALKKAGYVQYEISNFSKIGYESKHNLAYWNQKEYIGLGAGASSYANNVRYTNETSIEKYIEGINTNKDIRRIDETQTEEDKIREYMILRFRLTAGVNISEANQKFNIDILTKFMKEIKKLAREGLLYIDENRNIKLTDKGMDFANVVWREFV